MDRSRRLTALRGRAALLAAIAAAGLVSASAGLPAAAQTPPLGQAPWSRMSTLLEKTFLKIDVLTVDVCFDAATAAEFARLAAGGRLAGARGDSIARSALRGQRAAARIGFLRNVSLGQFLDGIDEDQRKAVAAGFMTDSVYREIRSLLPEWFAFLDRRGIRKDDHIRYELEPDSIRTVYSDPEGTVLLDQWDQGRERRNSVLATWLAPGSSFRSGLLASLEDAGVPGECRAL